MRPSEKTIRRRFGSFPRGDPAGRADLMLGGTKGLPNLRHGVSSSIPASSSRALPYSNCYPGGVLNGSDGR